MWLLEMGGRGRPLHLSHFLFLLCVLLSFLSLLSIHIFYSFNPSLLHSLQELSILSLSLILPYLSPPSHFSVSSSSSHFPFRSFSTQRVWHCTEDWIDCGR